MSENLIIRPEVATDARAIHALTELAFSTMAHSSKTEHLIVDELRRKKALSISLVAVRDGLIVGHVAVSPVTIANGAKAWFGLGPISVLPNQQRQGVGSQLMHSALQGLKDQNAAGCILLGDPNYYHRFGFRQAGDLVYPHAPSEYFQALYLNGDQAAKGEVDYHPAFSVQV